MLKKKNKKDKADKKWLAKEANKIYSSGKTIAEKQQQLRDMYAGSSLDSISEDVLCGRYKFLVFEVRDLGSILISILISACVMRVLDMIISLSAVEIGSVGEVIACFISIVLTSIVVYKTFKNMYSDVRDTDALLVKPLEMELLKEKLEGRSKK